MPNPALLLKNIFGYDSFKPLQEEVIDNILARRDTLAIMPTGGGKSLCYQIPALTFAGLTVVVSPLIALMKDQVEQLHANGVPALFLNSTLSYQAYQDNLEYVRRGEVKLLYVAPETLLTPRLFTLLDSVKVDFITIDEAHCISEWGHDFRPEYRQLVDARKRYPKAVCLALTATATPRVREDIQSILAFSHSNEFVASFNRENLYIEVLPKNDPVRQTIRFLERYKDQSGIIYCFSRKQVDDLSTMLHQKGFSVRPYHAGLEDAERKANQEAFIRDDIQIIVATIAFGMGINKPNVRFVLHYDLPKSIEGYYQEIGRAGRDGLPAHCLLLYSYADAAKQRYFIDQKEGDEHQVATQHLDAILQFAENKKTCRRKILLGYFGEVFPPTTGHLQINSVKSTSCDNCDNCTAPPPPAFVDITVQAQKFLSCVKRTGERFGAAHVTAVLRGSKNKKVLDYEHDKLPTYGIGADLTDRQWMDLAHQLVQLGYLNQDGEYRVLTLTFKALEALRKRSPILGSPIDSPSSPESQPETSQKSPGGKSPNLTLEYNNALYALLRQKRKELADQKNIPPYVIFSDKTLVEMAAFYPETPEKLLEISGVGQVKLHQYGEIFLEIIRSFCRKHKPPQNLEPTGRYKPAVRPKDASEERYILIGKAYNKGESISALMVHYKVHLSAILDHLDRFITSGNQLKWNDEIQSLSPVSPDEQQAIFEAFDTFGALQLKPIFDKMEGKFNYEALKILRLIYLSARN
jgi:ATP-dependent DNA helicase RecQ